MKKYIIEIGLTNGNQLEWWKQLETDDLEYAKEKFIRVMIDTRTLLNSHTKVHEAYEPLLIRLIDDEGALIKLVKFVENKLREN